MTPAQRDLVDLQRRALAESMAFVMGDKRGRLFVRYLLTLTKVDTEAMTGNSQTFHNLGSQAVGRQLRNELRATGLADWRRLEDEDAADARLMQDARSATGPIGKAVAP